MNRIILEDLRNDNIPNNIAQILPHQLATLDFLYQNCINNDNSVLLFHKMGSGKTIISLLFSIIICNIKKVIIVLPSYSILEMWKQNLYRSLILLPNKEYNLQNIEFTTRTKLNEDITVVGKTDIINEKIKNYNDYIMIIDEAHNFFWKYDRKRIINIAKKYKYNIYIIDWQSYNKYGVYHKRYSRTSNKRNF